MDYNYSTQVEAPKSKGKVQSIISLVCGILSLLCCVIPGFSFVPAIAGIILAIVAKKKAGKFPVMSLIGLIASIVGIVIGAIYLILFAVGAVSGLSGYFNGNY